MARLPGDRFLVQMIGSDVVVFETYTEHEVVRFNPTDRNATAKAQGKIHASEDLNDEEKSFAHFWAGYFYAHATL